MDKSFQRINIIEKTLDASWLKNQAVSNNLANVNTPGYKRQTVEFESLLKDYLELGDGVSMSRTHENHMAVNGPLSLDAQIKEMDNISYRTDQNSVNVDVEMSELAKNQIKYVALTNQLNGQLTRLKIAIKGK